MMLKPRNDPLIKDSRRVLRSYLTAALLAFCGFLLWMYDDMRRLEHGPPVLEVIEFLVKVPGLALLGFFISEFGRMREKSLAERFQRERFVALGRLAACIAHEIRNPLHNLNLLLDESVSNDARLGVNLQRINQAVDLVYLLGKPLSTSPDERQVDLVAVVNELNSNDLLQQSQRVQHLVPNVPVLVRANRAAVVLAVGNLLRNALHVEHGDSNPLPVQISYQETTLGEHPAWQLTICNHGRLPAAVRGLLSGASDSGAHVTLQPPGTQLSSKPDGLGLGLFITLQLTEHEGGTFAIKQNDEQVVAQLTLPRAEASL